MERETPGQRPRPNNGHPQGGVIVLLASPTAVLWTLFSRLLKRLRGQRSDAAAAAASEGGDSPQGDG